MIQNLASIKIGTIWNSGQGATFRDEVNLKPDLGSEIILSSPLQSELLLVRMKEGVTTVLENLHTTVNFHCSRCLEPFEYSIDIPTTERHFYEVEPERDFDPMESFLINKKEMSIDLTEALRQEIILHFPLIPVCSEHCKGLCLSCKVNLNRTDKHKTSCQAASEVQEPSSDTHKPFANLKDLLKN